MMATISVSWTEDVNVVLSDASPADNVQSTGSVDLDGGGYDAILIQVTIEWHGSAIDYADMNIYASADSGVTLDDIVLYNRRVDANAGVTESISMVIQDVPWIQIEIDNQSNQEMTSLVVEYAGRQWSSA